MTIHDETRQRGDGRNMGLDFGNPDFVMYAESHGAHGHRIESVDQLVPRMQDCHHAPGVHGIDVPMDSSDNDRVPNRAIPEKSRLP